MLAFIGLLMLTGCLRPLADRRHTDDPTAQLRDTVKVIQTATAQAALAFTRAAAPTRTPSPTPRITMPAPTATPRRDASSPIPGRSVTVTPTPRAVEGAKLYLRDKLLSTEPPAANTSARFECYGACAYTWPMTLTVPLTARSYGYRLDISSRFSLKLTLTHAGNTSVLVDARRLTAGSPAQGILGGAVLAGAPGDVLTLELTLPDGGQIFAHRSGSGGLTDELFGGGSGGSASFIILSQAEPPPTPSPAAPVGARLAANRGASSGPAIAAGPDDTLHVAWAAASEGSPAIFYARSSDGGVTFSAPVTVARGPDAAARGAPAIAGGANGAIAIAWEEKRDGVWGIVYSHSTDGKSFSPAVLMGSPTADSDRSDPTLASAADGTLYLAWRDLRVGETGGIYFARAAAGGDFGTETAVSPYPEFQGDPVLAVDQQGRVHLAWTDRRDGPAAVYYAHADDGVTFGAARRISQDGSHTPSLALDKNGGLHLAWASPLLYVYHTHYISSKDGGDTFGQEVMLNDGGASVSVSAPLTAIAAGTDGTVYVAFRTNSPRDGTVLHYDRAKNGAFGRDVTLAGDKGSPAPSQPAMTSDSRGRVFLAWGENVAGTFQVYLARAEAGGEFSPKGKVVGGPTGIASAGGETKTTPVPEVSNYARPGSVSLALDSTGRPYISFSTGLLQLAHWDGDAWRVETVDVDYESRSGEYSSLALNAAGQPHIAYSDDSNHKLKYARWDGSVWRIEIVDNIDGATGQYSGGLLAMALDRNGYPHISYYSTDLKYAYKDAVGWHIRIIDSGGMVGRFSSIGVDRNGYPHIAYFIEYLGSSPFYDLKYAHQDASGWYTETVDSEGDAGLYTSLALDASGHPHISYYADCRLKYAHWDGSAWHIEPIDVAGSCGYAPLIVDTSLALDNAGQPHISYYRPIDWNQGDLKYARKDEAGWHIKLVESGGVGQANSLALDAAGRPRIAYVGNYRLKFTHWLDAPLPTLTPTSRPVTPTPVVPVSAPRSTPTPGGTPSASPHAITTPTKISPVIATGKWFSILSADYQAQTIVIRFDNSDDQSAWNSALIMDDGVCVIFQLGPCKSCMLGICQPAQEDKKSIDWSDEEGLLRLPPYEIRAGEISETLAIKSSKRLSDGCLSFGLANFGLSEIAMIARIKLCPGNNVSISYKDV
jgi:hypothetical protein